MIEADEFKLEEKKLDYSKRREEVPNGRKKKGFWDKAFKQSKLKKPNTVAVIFLRKNGNAEPMELQSIKGFFTIYGRPYHEDRDCVYRMGRDKVPLAIIPEWNLLPIGKKEWEDKTMQEKFSTLETHVINGIRNAELIRMSGDTGFSKINMKTAIVWGIIGIVCLAIVWGYVGQ